MEDSKNGASKKASHRWTQMDTDKNAVGEYRLMGKSAFPPARQSRNQRNLTADFTDFTDWK
jgi:hypothetical protein